MVVLLLQGLLPETLPSQRGQPLLVDSRERAGSHQAHPLSEKGSETRAKETVALSLLSSPGPLVSHERKRPQEPAMGEARPRQNTLDWPPVLIVGTRDDELIGTKHATALATHAGAHGRLVWLSSGGHCDGPLTHWDCWSSLLAPSGT